MKINIKTPLFVLALALGMSACKDNNTDNVGPETAEAVFVNANISTPDGYVNYIGAFPELPTTLDRSRLVEFGRDAHVATTYKGNIYTYAANTKAVTRWNVDKNNTISRAGSFSVADKQVGSYPGFVVFSDTRGFIFEVQQGKVIEFNPETMTITKEIAVPAPERPYAYYGFLPKVHGNKIVANLSESDWDTKTMQKRVGVVLFDVTTEKLTYHFDSRSHTTYEYFLDSKGFFYALPDFWANSYKVLGNSKDAPKTTMLRFDVNAGQFDPSFALNVEEILNGYVMNVYPITDTKFFISYAPKPLNPAINYDNAWTEVKGKAKILDITTGKASDIPGLTGEYNTSSAGEASYTIDNVLYVPMAIRQGDNTITTIYRITESGATRHSEHNNVWFSEISRLR
jgi:hypothetical protein